MAETAFTPTTILDWMENSANAAASQVAQDYMRVYRDIAMEEFAKGTSMKRLTEKLKEVTPATARDSAEVRAARAARTLTTAAYTYGKLQRYMQDPIVIGYRFVAVLDAVTTKICSYLDGRRFSKEDVFNAVPPMHYNCRSDLAPITAFEDPNKYPDALTRPDDPAQAALYDEAFAEKERAERGGFKTPEGVVQFTDKKLSDPTTITPKAEAVERYQGVELRGWESFANRIAKTTDNPKAAVDIMRQAEQSSIITEGQNMVDSFDQLGQAMDYIGQYEVPGAPKDPATQERIQKAKEKAAQDLLRAFNGAHRKTNIDAPAREPLPVTISEIPGT